MPSRPAHVLRFPAHGVGAFASCKDAQYDALACGAPGATVAVTPALTSKYGDLCRAIEELKRRGFVEGGQQVAIVQSGRQPIWRSASTHVISVREVPLDPESEDA